MDVRSIVDVEPEDIDTFDFVDCGIQRSSPEAGAIA